MTLSQVRIPVSALIMLAGGLVTLLVIVVLLIMPLTRETVALEREIVATTAQIEEKRLLDPLYAAMRTIEEDQEALALPPVTAVKPFDGDIGEVSRDLELISIRSGMSMVSATPSPASLEGGSPMLEVNLVVEGDYTAFREFLLALLEVPYLHAIPGFQIREIVGGREYSLQLKVLLQ